MYSVQSTHHQQETLRHSCTKHLLILLHLKVVGGVCYALVIHSGVNVPYLEERGYHFERREYRFNFRHVPDSMRDQLLKSFPQGGKKGCSFLERGELPQSGGELFLPDHFTNLL